MVPLAAFPSLLRVSLAVLTSVSLAACVDLDRDTPLFSGSTADRSDYQYVYPNKSKAPPYSQPALPQTVTSEPLQPPKTVDYVESPPQYATQPVYQPASPVNQPSTTATRWPQQVPYYPQQQAYTPPPQQAYTPPPQSQAPAAFSPKPGEPFWIGNWRDAKTGQVHLIDAARIHLKGGAFAQILDNKTGNSTANLKVQTPSGRVGDVQVSMVSPTRMKLTVNNAGAPIYLDRINQ